MVSRIIAFTKHNPRYLKFNRPEEDSFRYSVKKKRITLVVADGITRDPLGFREFPEKFDESAIKKFAASYPNPSPAKIAADLFCETFVRSGHEQVLKIFEECNNKIKRLNHGLKVDYLENDFAACVASGGVIENGILYWGFIADCGICVFNEKFELVFRTPDEGPRKEIDEDAKKSGKNWNQSEWRARVRSYYRNNTKNPFSYGAFTGEDSALKFVKCGKREIKEKDIVIFYSDGMGPLLFSGEINKLKNVAELENYVDKNLEKIQGAEGTIVAFEI